jgi:hypothetical protein
MFRGNGCKGYSLEINTSAEGAAFIRWITDNPFPWQGPRNDDQPVNIRFRMLSSPEDAVQVRRLAPLHDWLTKNIEDSSSYHRSMQVKTNPRKDRTSVETENDCFVIAEIVNDNVVFDEGSLTYFGFSLKIRRDIVGA